MTSSAVPRVHPEEPEAPTGKVQLQPPPQLDPGQASSGALLNLIPMLGSVGSIVMVSTMSGGGGRQYLSAGMFLFATVGFLLVQLDRQQQRRRGLLGARRDDYLRYLAGVRTTARDAADLQRRALAWHHPEPGALPALAAERSRLWERGPTRTHFLKVRYGVRTQPAALELIAPERDRLDHADPVALAALDRLLAVHGSHPGLPATVDLRLDARIEVCGREDDARAAARALICSAAAFHGPDVLRVAVLCPARAMTEWDWAKWLPHAESTHVSDAVGPRRLVAADPDELASLLSEETAQTVGHPGTGATTHLLLVVDGVDVRPEHRLLLAGGPCGVTVLDLPERWGESPEGGLRLDLTLDRLVRPRQEPVPVVVDRLTPAVAEAFARRLAPLRWPGTVPRPGRDRRPGPADLMQLLGLGAVRSLDPAAAWQSLSPGDALRVPIGLGEAGAPVHLDLKEPAEEGVGPHGLVIGATGSGKSELLRTLVLGLALTHSPERLTMVLVDFKGGATFAGMAAMPHVSALITNLAGELALVDRMQDALSGEMVRRQELLRAAGNVASLKEYERARAGDPSRLPPLSSLLIVVDEFSEMLTAKPEFIDLFVAIGRLGRSLGLHLLLASQRLEEGRLRGLESHLSYRVGLRTFSAQESRSVLGVPDAYELPATPGAGYLRSGPTSLHRFQATHVSAPPRPHEPPPDRSADPRRILPFGLAEVSDPTVGDEPGAKPVEPLAPVRPVAPIAPSESLLDIAVRRMAGHGPPVHRVWLPPLDEPDSLGDLMPDLTLDPHLGLVSPGWRGRGGLVVPVGAVDRPREQRRDTLTLDLRGAGGHVAVVGGPRSGKSSLLRTIVASLALTTTPLESQFLLLDLGGGALAQLARLPHVIGVAARSEPDVVRRVVAEVREILDRREAYFREHGIDSIETYRQRRTHGTSDGYGDVFLVIDGWGTLRESFDDLDLELQRLAPRALTFGVHLVVGTVRWSDFRAAVRDMLGTRLELRLGDPLDSEIDRRLAAQVPVGRPGRGLVPDRLHFLAAVPRLDRDARPETLGAGVDALVLRAEAAWRGPVAPKLRLLPERIELEEIRSTVRDAPGADRPGGSRLLLGVGERGLSPVALDPDTQPHLVAYGERGSGKSTLLRVYACEVMRTRAPTAAQLVILDPRRSLLGEVPQEYLLHYLTNAAQAASAITDVATYLSRRIPGTDVTPAQLRSRSWWTGAEVFVVVDDYELVTTAQDSPLQALLPLLAQAADVGLHLAVARRTGGAARALYDPVIQALRDLGSPGLLLSGSPDEGPLLGGLRPAPAVPGRGRLISRERGVETMQVGWRAPAL